MATTPIGLINHFTNIAPDVETTKHFYIDFLGGTWYSENFRLHQVALGGVLIDCFPPEQGAEAMPEPGCERQGYRFAIDPAQVGAWVEHAEDWRVRTTMLVEPELRRLSLKFDTPNGYHIALGATYASVEALDEAVEEYGGRIEALSRITEPFTINSGPVTATR
jgi:hypothetical protein